MYDSMTKSLEFFLIRIFLKHFSDGMIFNMNFIYINYRFFLIIISLAESLFFGHNCLSNFNHSGQCHHQSWDTSWHGMTLLDVQSNGFDFELMYCQIVSGSCWRIWEIRFARKACYLLACFDNKCSTITESVQEFYLLLRFEFVITIFMSLVSKCTAFYSRRGIVKRFIEAIQSF